MIECTGILRTVIDEFICKIIKEYDDHILKITHNTRGRPKKHQPRPVICEDYLSVDD
jgi:hypothetical protein